VKRLFIPLIAGLLAIASFAGPALAGNGAPQGSHEYQLDIIGTSDKNDATDGDWGGEGRRIFVDLWGDSRIALSEGDYEVLDANGTDGWASFQLPAPGLDAFVVGEEGDADVESDYSVFVRPLGKPGGWATITTCADLLDSTFAGLLGNRQISSIENTIDDETGAYCSIEQVGNILDGDMRTFRSTGKTVFSNVTTELLTILFEVVVCTETDPDTGECVAFETFFVRVPIFDDLLENEYWLYDNHGLRLLQVRFYDCSTNVATGESTC
jgi:hypothetical protein